MRDGLQKNDPKATRGPSAGLRRCFAASILIALALASLHWVQLILLLSADNCLLILMAVLGGVLMGDFVSGLVHWACDTWGSENSKWLGPSLIRAFREHHREPEAMLDHDWIEISGELASASAASLLALALLSDSLALAQHPSAYAFLWALICAGGLANQLHQWAHMTQPPALLRHLQRVGLILSRPRHALHHRAPHTTGYCISTGWLNVPLDTVSFWRVLEKTVTAVTGALPRRELGIQELGIQDGREHEAVRLARRARDRRSQSARMVR